MGVEETGNCGTSAQVVKARCVGRSLHHIHQKGICHRYIKPQNLLVNTATHQLKLCDFGSAKVPFLLSPFLEAINLQAYSPRRCILKDQSNMSA